MWSPQIPRRESYAEKGILVYPSTGSLGSVSMLTLRVLITPGFPKRVLEKFPKVQHRGAPLSSRPFYTSGKYCRSLARPYHSHIGKTRSHPFLACLSQALDILHVNFRVRIRAHLFHPTRLSELGRDLFGIVDTISYQQALAAATL